MAVTVYSLDELEHEWVLPERFREHLVRGLPFWNVVTGRWIFVPYPSVLTPALFEDVGPGEKNPDLDEMFKLGWLEHMTVEGQLSLGIPAGRTGSWRSVRVSEECSAKARGAG